ncbi:MAG TPA: M1 family aminopeptidase [Candidatus Acidoferrum sp.]|nr:M1 family aminopeptidase [Candidatus Acidoferrum sp.]
MAGADTNMLWQIFSFEVRYWLRSWMLWIFFLIIAVLIFFATATDNVTLGDALTNTYRNAPFVIQNFYSFMGLFAILMATAFVNSAASRDFNFNTFQIIFSTPMRRFDFLVGRFLGATLVSLIPILGVSAGIILAKLMPWIQAERWGPIAWKAHLYGILVFALPNALILASILFAIAVLARNEIAAFVGAIALLVLYASTDGFLANVDRQKLGAILDPFGIRTFAYITRYWTVAEKNTLSVDYSGYLLWNRLLWIAVALAIFAFAYYRFSFTERKKKSRRKSSEHSPSSVAAELLPKVTFRDASFAKYRAAVSIHFWGVAKSTVFIVILLLALSNCVPALAFNANQLYGNKTFPVTYWVLDIIAGTFYMFLVAIITYFAGLLVWKDRDTGMDEIVDSQPSPEWVYYASRLTALLGLVFIILAVVMTAGVVVQAAMGYHRFQIALYLKELFLRNGSLFFFLAVLAFFIHVLAPNKYLGYFFYVAFLLANLFVWRPLNVATNLVKFANRPRVLYSDFFRDAPARAAWDWHALYWLLFCGLLAIATVMFWPRGKQAKWSERFDNARLRFSGGWLVLLAICLLSFGSVGAWAYYNTRVLNEYVGPKDMLHLQADYEKTYKPLEKTPMPRVRSLKYNIEIFPEQRNMVMQGEAILQNPYSTPVEEIHLTLNRLYDTTVGIPGAKLVKDDKRLYYQIYKFSPPLAPNETRTAHFTVKADTHGFENEVSDLTVVQNGTFFNNGVAPIIGYSSQNELADPADRKKYGLGEQQLMPPLERNCTTDCMDNYGSGHADWVDVETTISTSADQIAIAPGSLLNEWQKDGRRYFHYKLDHPALDFYSFISARYEVAREEWNGVKVEVYYLREHPWNIPRMLKSIEKSLDYCARNFGPYYHKEARIIEFPRIATFAQAFPGTMPYSESIGFIANFDDPEDIDMVYYVVAHEMAHQWWAHQVIGANMQGATLLSETMAQYSALMIMEHEYGRDIMRKFLRFEMDRYLGARGRELQKERPLLMVEAGQGYIHYRKGSVVLYYLKEMIGEEAINRALRRMVQQYAYAQPPYPTSWVLVDELKKETPPEYQYLLKDLFEDITIFSNRTLEATAEKRTDGKYDVKLDIETHKYKADEKGNEKEVPLDDWIEIGAFAKPAKGKKYGKTLYRQRLHLTSNKSTQTFTVDELPDQAGVDPFLLLIDRVPDDNTKKPTLVTTTAAAHK